MIMVWEGFFPHAKVEKGIEFGDSDYIFSGGYLMGGRIELCIISANCVD